MEDAPIAEVLAQLRGVGVVFNNAALGSLAQLHAATQIAILEKIRDYVCNPSVLLMCFIELEQTSYGLRKQSLAHTKTPSVAAGAGLERGQPRPQSWPHVSTSSNALPRSCATHIIRLDEPCTAPAKSYLMCQPGLGGGACPQVGRACHAGAAGPYDVEYALSLCGGGIVYLTVRGLRDVESFPWELPAGWYALHAAPYGVLEPLQLKVPGAGIAIPPNLPTGCIVALVKLGNPKRSEDFDGKQWALGRWRRAIEDVLMLQSCVASPTDALQRVWIMPEAIRSQVLASIPGVNGKPASDPACLWSAVENAVDLHASSRVRARIEEPGDLTTGLCPVPCKRPRPASLLHASFPSVPPCHVDRLQKLYPHSRDQDCHLDDKDHKYIVHGDTYGLSVSGWWKKYFEEFDPKRVSENIVDRHLENSGFRTNSSGETTEDVLLSSVYNFAQHIRVFEKRDDEVFLDCLYRVATAAQADYARRGARLPFTIERIVEAGKQLLLDMRKPTSRLSCYYLMLLHTVGCGAQAQAAQMARTWELHGSLESLKGTYLHKKIELFINAMALPMETSGSLRVPVGELLRETLPAHEYSAATVMRHISWAQDAELWDHPLAQSFFQSELRGESVEFAKFRAWLLTKPF